MTLEIVCIAIVAACWGGYPLVARWSGYGGPLGTLVLSLAGLLPIALAVLWQGGVARPSPAALAKLAVAGVLMGCGLLAFNRLANSRLDASISIPIVDTAMLIVTTLGAIYFFQEAVTARKLVGLALLVAGIVALRPV
ncbi:MAG TPA: EamA family transporter [Myxococcota bacterium]